MRYSGDVCSIASVAVVVGWLVDVCYIPLVGVQQGQMLQFGLLHLLLQSNKKEQLLVYRYNVLARVGLERRVGVLLALGGLG